MPIDGVFNWPFPVLSFERPHRGSQQVRKLSIVRPGIYEVWVFNLNGEVVRRSLILILSKPFQDTNGAWQFEYTDWPRTRCLKRALCSDMGIVSYSHDLWNITNALFRTRERHLTDEELAKVRARLGK